MCVNGEFILALDVMNARCDYQGRRSMSVVKIVDGVMSMGMLSVVEVVISCHIFLHITILFCFLYFYIFISFGLTIMVVIGFFFHYVYF